MSDHSQQIVKQFWHHRNVPRISVNGRPIVRINVVRDGFDAPHPLSRCAGP